MDEQEQQEQEINLTPDFMTYVRYIGVILADIIAVYSLYQSFDFVLASALTAFTVVFTLVAAWKNNSITKGAIAADYMKDAFSDAENQEEIKNAWKQLNDTFHAVYTALKEAKEK